MNGGTVVGALERIAEGIGGKEGDTSPIVFPSLAIGPVEEVLIFEVVGHVVLVEQKGKDWDAFWHITGNLIDLTGMVLNGGQFETVFPFKFELAQYIPVWPARQGGPFDVPPVNGANTADFGFSKTNFIFPGGDSLVTVGPSIPKIVLLKGGAAQFWVTSVGVTTDGTGRFAGARGMGAFNGSAYFAKAPDFSTEKGRKPLREGFPVKVSINIKLVAAERLAEAPPGGKPGKP